MKLLAVRYNEGALWAYDDLADGVAFDWIKPIRPGKRPNRK